MSRCRHDCLTALHAQDKNYTYNVHDTRVMRYHKSCNDNDLKSGKRKTMKLKIKQLCI